MLALWSRATQNPGTCRCISCLPNAATAARRVGRAGIRGAWASGTPTSTFAYTAMFAAGMAIDATAKQRRNRQWDEAFAQLKESMDRPPAGEATTSERAWSEKLTMEELPEDINWETIQRAVGMELADDWVLRAQELKSLHRDLTKTPWDDLDTGSRLLAAEMMDWPANTGRDLVRHNLPPQSLWAHDTVRLTALRRRHTWKKLAMQELSTGLLIHNLMSHADFSQHSKVLHTLENLSPQILQIASFDSAEVLAARIAILKKIEKLHVIDVETFVDEKFKATIGVDQPGMPGYFQDAYGDFYGICQQMNTGIEHLLRQATPSKDSEYAVTIAKICHNLLVSTAAPDLKTFNLLISEFRRWQRPGLVDDVIAAFYVSKIRPNEIFCREILGYYKTTNRPDDFSRFVAKMRGVGDALMLANPEININEASQGRLLRIDEKKVYQKMHPTPMVFSALIDGVMHFAGFDRALDIYYEMKADGWGLDMPGLTALLADCIHRADWEGGSYLWEEICSIKARASPTEMARAYYHMLSLCSVTGNTVTFNQVLGEVVRRGFDRKSIINAATRTTAAAKWERQDNMAPAWAADNLMIAVSDYIGDMRAPGQEAVPEFDDEQQDLFARNTPDEGELGQEIPADPKEAWASWVEAEFGERPEDPEA